jgi:hypothetical protein
MTQYGRYSTRMTNGVPQGSTLSPMLFNIVAEDLAETLKIAGIVFQLYADDLVVIGDDEEVRRSIGLVEEWAERNNMEVNRAKSGVLNISGSSVRPGEEIGGYPVVKTYKYLGLMLNGQLNMKDHLKAINRKANFIAHRLYGIRRIDDLRMNMNMFRTFVMPSYRLAFTLYARLNAAERAKIEAHMRVWCKKFIRVPINTASHTFSLIVGDLKKQM